jgi:hypothetical protein
MRKLLFAAAAAGFALTVVAIGPASAKSNTSNSLPSASQQGYGANGGGDSDNATCSHFTGCQKY